MQLKAKVEYTIAITEDDAILLGNALDSLRHHHEDAKDWDLFDQTGRINELIHLLEKRPKV